MPTRITSIPITVPIALSDGDLSAERVADIQLLITGNFQSTRFGKFSITEQHIDRMVNNFDSVHPVRPTELMIDYDHLSERPAQPGDGRAAGWFKRLYKKLSATGKPELWATVEFTEPAAEAVKRKEYRFFSPTFMFDYVTNVGKKIGATLLAGALTNRPFLQGMQAITLSLTGEVAGVAGPQTRKSNMPKITLKDENDNDVLVELSAIIGNADVKAALAPVAPPAAPPAAPVSEDVKTLAATVAALTATITGLSESHKQTQLTLATDRAERDVMALMAAGKVAPKDKQTWVDLATRDHATFVTLSATLPVSVKLGVNHGGDKGTTKVPAAGIEPGAQDDSAELPEPGEAAIKLFDDTVDAARAKDPKLTTDAAMSLVARDNPALAKLYRESYRQA